MWVVSSKPRPHFTPVKDPVPILQEAVWAPWPGWTGGKFRPHRDSIPDRPIRSSVAIPTELLGSQWLILLVPILKTIEAVYLVISRSLYIPCPKCGVAICRWLAEHKWHILLHIGRLECVSSIITDREQCRRRTSMSIGWQTLGSLRVVMFSQRCGWVNITLMLGRNAASHGVWSQMFRDR